MRKIMLAVAIFMLASVFTGCAKEAPELAEKMSEKVQNKVSCEMKVQIEGVTGGEKTLSGELRILVNKGEAERVSRTEGVLALDTSGDNEKIPVLEYLLAKDGETVAYTSDEQTGKWEKYSVSVQDNQRNLFKILADKKETIAVDKELADVDGLKCYVLTTSVNEKELKEAASVFASLSGYELQVLSGIPDADVSLYLDKKTLLPVKCRIINEGFVSLTVTFDSWDNTDAVGIPEAATKLK